MTHSTPKPLVHVAHSFQRLTLDPEDLHAYVPPEGWEVECVGPSFAPQDRERVCVTIRRCRPTAQTILTLALEQMQGSRQATFPWLASKLDLSVAELETLLMQAGLRGDQPAFAHRHVFRIQRRRIGDPPSLGAYPFRKEDDDWEKLDSPDLEI